MDASTSLKLFVYIIESPDPKDILDGNTEGKALTEALKLSGIRSNYSLAIDDETFDLALRDRLAEVIRLYPDRLPMLHVSCHGSDDGIQLTNGRFISWEELRRRLLPINEALRGFLVVTLSSCFGGFGWKAAMYVDGPLPFYGLVGHVGKVTWSDAAVAYIAFYHRFCKGAHIKDAVEAMRAASGDSGFTYSHAGAVQKSFRDYMEREGAEYMRNALLEMLSGAPEPEIVGVQQAPAADPIETNIDPDRDARTD